MNNLDRIALYLCFIFVCLLLPNIVFSQEKKDKIIVGAVVKEFGLSPSAVMAGCKPFSEYITERLGIETKMKIVPDVEALVASFKDGSINYGLVENQDYVKLKAKNTIVPFVKAVKGGTSTYKAVILVRNDSGINSMADLKGKNFAYVTKSSSHGYMFPSLTIKSLFGKTMDQFFGSQTQYKKDTDSILAVYYKKADVVSTSDITFEILSELRPQIKRKLKVLEVSDPFVFGPIFYYKDNIMNMETVAKLKDEIINMKNVPEGDQLLMIFKIGDWTEARDEDYDGLRKLMQKDQQGVINLAKPQ